MTLEDTTTEQPGGTLLSAVSNSIVAMMKKYYGRGPTAAKTYLLDDNLVVVMQDGFTTVERTLLDGGPRAPGPGGAPALPGRDGPGSSPARSSGSSVAGSWATRARSSSARRRSSRCSCWSPPARASLSGRRRRVEHAGMPTYIMLSTLTPEGVQTVKNNPQRIREVNKELEQLGAASRRSGPRSAATTSSTSSRHPTTRRWPASRSSWGRAAPRSSRPRGDSHRRLHRGASTADVRESPRRRLRRA
jgi:hypothetical protein